MVVRSAVAVILCGSVASHVQLFIPVMPTRIECRQDAIPRKAGVGLNLSYKTPEHVERDCLRKTSYIMFYVVLK